MECLFIWRPLLVLPASPSSSSPERGKSFLYGILLRPLKGTERVKTWQQFRLYSLYSVNPVSGKLVVFHSAPGPVSCGEPVTLLKRGSSEKKRTKLNQIILSHLGFLGIVKYSMYEVELFLIPHGRALSSSQYSRGPSSCCYSHCFGRQ